MTDTQAHIIYACLLLVVLFNLFILLAGSARASNRERAKREAENVVELQRYRRGNVVDIRA